MAGSSSKGGDHFWPGFVDALTNVVIAMVFVIVVLAIALSFSMQLMAQRMAARIAELEQQGRAAQAVEAPEKGDPAPSVRGGMPAGPTPATAPADAGVAVAERIPVRGTEREQTPKKGVAMQSNNRHLLLDYETGALTLDEAAAKRLADSLAPFKEALDRDGPNARLAVTARGPSMELSENQRAGYIRVMAVRNVLLDNGIPAARITTRIDTRAEAERNTVDLSMEIKP